MSDRTGSWATLCRSISEIEPPRPILKVVSTQCAVVLMNAFVHSVDNNHMVFFITKEDSNLVPIHASDILYMIYPPR
ncbi:MAG: hypothetical protein ABIH67_00535 [Candidatus Uhrbacteria bacterium]